ncbi:MAG: serine/threonine protein kinase, partial [Chloroflexales bacterium]|nr:serine/threonine protein kinase [Chloroflexales bacterium]
MSILPPNTLIHNRYKVVQQIGQGGFGAVYEAMDERLGRRVALKQLLHASDNRVSRQFELEARLLANLSHSALPRVTDHFSEASGQFLVMDFVSGQDLMNMLLQRNAPFPLDQVLQWGGQILDVLHYLHSRHPPVIHRDLKPHNLKVQANGALILLDFGLAKGFAGDVAPPTTQSSFLAYTRGFASPEQMEGRGTDARSDLYALGATLHCLLTNTAPPEAQTRELAVLRGRPDPLRPTHELNPQVTVAVSQVLQRALALEPNDRPASAQAMWEQLLEAYPAARRMPQPVSPIGDSPLPDKFRDNIGAGSDQTAETLPIPAGSAPSDSAPKNPSAPSAETEIDGTEVDNSSQLVSPTAGPLPITPSSGRRLPPLRVVQIGLLLACIV